MKVYLVRHGESTANVSKIHQTPDEPLTENGKQQAKNVAERFKTIKIDKIVTSPFTRATDTAHEIQAITGVPIETNDVFVEVKRPSELMGTIRGASEANKVFDEIMSHEDDPSWHYSDEENFHDMKKRAEKALQILENGHVEQLAVVTHSVFLRMIIGVLTFQDNMSPDILRKLGNHFKIHNTGITVLHFDTEEKFWRLLTWNDYAHLGD